MIDNHSDKKDEALLNSVYWSLACCFQGRRLKKVLDKAGDIFSTAHAEKQFFLSSVLKLERWLKLLLQMLKSNELSDTDNKIVSFLETQMTIFKQPKNLRNIMEHDDEYRFGKGRQQELDFVQIKAGKGTINIHGTGHLNVKISGKTFLGGMVDFPELMTALDGIRRFLVEKYNEQVEKNLISMKYKQAPIAMR